MRAGFEWLFEFFLTWPGMAVIIVVCVGNGIACRARRAVSNGFGLTILAVSFAPIAMIWLMWSGTNYDPREKKGDRLTHAIIAAVVLFALIWIPVAIRCFVDERKPVEPMQDKPTGGFWVITKDERR